MSPAESQAEHATRRVGISAAAATVTRYFKSHGNSELLIAHDRGRTSWGGQYRGAQPRAFSRRCGSFGGNRVTRVKTAGVGTVTPFDLNPGIRLLAVPEPCGAGDRSRATDGHRVAPDGTGFWITSFGTDRVGEVDAKPGGPRGSNGTDQRHHCGPRCKPDPRLALQASSGRLFVLNRISNTISVVSNGGPERPHGGAGRELRPDSRRHPPRAGFFYDARLSGNGTQSCASCHIDGPR